MMSKVLLAFVNIGLSIWYGILVVLAPIVTFCFISVMTLFSTDPGLLTLQDERTSDSRDSNNNSSEVLRMHLTEVRTE
jgi:hypothetical protein